jgi:hypothetical protein
VSDRAMLVLITWKLAIAMDVGKSSPLCSLLAGAKRGRSAYFDETNSSAHPESLDWPVARAANGFVHRRGLT